jgi:hypothetical protein
MNVTGEPANYPRFTLGEDLLGGKRVSSVRDAETGNGWRQTHHHWFTYEERGIQIERHGLLLLAVE